MRVGLSFGFGPLRFHIPIANTGRGSRRTATSAATRLPKPRRVSTGHAVLSWLTAAVFLLPGSLATPWLISRILPYDGKTLGPLYLVVSWLVGLWALWRFARAMFSYQKQRAL